jgi:hypothetical protein
MSELKRQELFAVGEWNGTQFSEADLDAMVQSFEALGLAGRVPLKFGHDSPKPDGQPSLGWVSRVWREGSKLLADFSNVPEKVLSLIRDRAYKFVSVELLKNVRAGTREIPWVLDAVALLGADQPAVGILKELTMSARAGLRFEARVAFTRGNLMSGERKSMDEVTQLRAELARAKQDAALNIVKAAVDSGRCLPRELHAFKRRYSDPSLWTPELATEWVQLTELPAHQRAKYSTRATRAEQNDEQRQVPAEDSDAIGDLFRATAKRLGIADPFNASASDQYRVWRATRQAAPEAYSSYATAPGVS